MFSHLGFSSASIFWATLAGILMLLSTSSSPLADTQAEVQVNVTINQCRVPLRPFTFHCLSDGGLMGRSRVPRRILSGGSQSGWLLGAHGDPSDGTIHPDDLLVGSEGPGGPYVQMSEGLEVVIPSAGQAIPLRFPPTWRYAPGNYDAQLILRPNSGGDGVLLGASAWVPAFVQIQILDPIQGPDYMDNPVLISGNDDTWGIMIICDGPWELVNDPRQVTVVSPESGIIMGRGPIDQVELVIRTFGRSTLEIKSRLKGGGSAGQEPARQ